MLQGRDPSAQLLLPLQCQLLPPSQRPALSVLPRAITGSLGGFLYGSLGFVCQVLLFLAARWYVEVPRLGVQSGLQLPAYTTATAMRDP